MTEQHHGSNGLPLWKIKISWFLWKRDEAENLSTHEYQYPKIFHARIIVVSLSSLHKYQQTKGDGEAVCPEGPEYCDKSQHLGSVTDASQPLTPCRLLRVRRALPHILQHIIKVFLTRLCSLQDYISHNTGTLFLVPHISNYST